jgi:NADPH:quinone reductase-like Zn-dependent oxidoreductase
MAKAAVGSVFIRQQGRPFIAAVTKEHLLELKALVEAGRITPVVEHTYTLAEVPEAMNEIAGGHVRGKVLIEL